MRSVSATKAVRRSRQSTPFAGSVLHRAGPAGAGARLLGRQVHQREVVAARRAGCPSPRRRRGAPRPPARTAAREIRVRVAGRGPALGFDEQRPARAQAAQRVVQPRRRGRSRPASRCRGQARESAVRWNDAILVQHDARRDQPRPGQPVGQRAAAGGIRRGSAWQSPHTSSSGRCLMWRAKTAMNCGSTRAPQTASAWPTIQSTTPGIHSCRPSPRRRPACRWQSPRARRAAQQDRLGQASDAAAPRSRARTPARPS